MLIITALLLPLAFFGVESTSLRACSASSRRSHYRTASVKGPAAPMEEEHDCSVYCGDEP